MYEACTPCTGDLNYDRALTIAWSSLALEMVISLRKGRLAYTLT